MKSFLRLGMARLTSACDPLIMTALRHAPHDSGLFHCLHTCVGVVLEPINIPTAVNNPTCGNRTGLCICIAMAVLDERGGGRFDGEKYQASLAAVSDGG